MNEADSEGNDETKQLYESLLSQEAVINNEAFVWQFVWRQ